MSEVIEFRKAEDRNVDRITDQMWALIENEDVLTGINACMRTLVGLLAGQQAMHPDQTGLAERCAQILPGMVAEVMAAEILTGLE